MTINDLILLLSATPAEQRDKDIVNDEDYCDCMEPQVGDICHITIYRTETDE